MNKRFTATCEHDEGGHSRVCVVLPLLCSVVLVAVTVWNQKGSRNKFRKRGVYHIPAEHESWEDIRENILNYNEEGGGEQDQVRKPSADLLLCQSSLLKQVS